MSGLRSRLTAQLGRFDEEAYVALANRGLLRRAQKDLEKQPATIIEESAELVTLAFGGFEVRIDARGPAQAQCSCPASGVCQHILAAAITLQRMDAGEAPRAETDAACGRTAGLHAALLALTREEMMRHAGKAGYRWAWRFVQDLEPENGVRIAEDAYIKIRFSHPRMEFRYLGGDLDSIIADVSIAQIEKYRVAAVLAYRRANGAEIEQPETVGRTGTAALDLGKDHAPASDQPHAGTEARKRLLASARQLVEECVQLGLSHLSRGIQERFATLAVWAQGAEYHRRAMLLRRLADHVELLLERAGAADEHRLLDEMSLAFGLICALQAAAAQGEDPARLTGRARSRYAESGRLELLGLGASAWRSASGYLGLTMLFWSVQDKAFLSCTDARPESRHGFDPAARYKAAGPWGGLGAPAQATGRRILLTGAQLSAGGRLSAHQDTTATVQPPSSATDFVQHLQPCSSWDELRQARNSGTGSLLAEPQPMKDWVVLQPRRYGAARFDGPRQTLVWPLYDDSDQQLDAELAYGELTAHAIARIEQLRPEYLASGVMLVARIRRSRHGLVAEPLSLVRPQVAADENPVDALYFDPPAEQGMAAKWLAALRRTMPRAGMPEVQAEPPPSLPAALTELRHWLCRQAERGLSIETEPQVLAHMKALGDKAAASGLTTFGRLATGGSGAGKLLQMHYVCLQYQRLLE